MKNGILRFWLFLKSYYILFYMMLPCRSLHISLPVPLYRSPGNSSINHYNRKAMTLKFRKVQRKVLSGDDKDKVKTYAMARSSNYCDMDKLCELISSRSAMSSVDVKAILDSLNWAMSLELRSGSIVQVGEFGSFRLSIRSKGAETADAFNASLIKKARVIFSPGTSLRWMSEIVKFEEDEDTKPKKEEGSGGDDRPEIE